MDDNGLSRKLKVLVRNAALDMPRWNCLAYTEKDYRRKEMIDALEGILLSILLVVCIWIIFFECGG